MYGQRDTYFQQRVDYRIQATLVDSLHLLRAHLSLDYYNQSPDTLHELVFHLWPRAYRSDATALAKQFLLDGNTDFHFAAAKDRGDLDSLDFRSQGVALPWQLDAQHPDLARISLPLPLPPGQKIVITTPFRVKIPASFSRLGRVGTSYQMTQWYPKPAVYDRQGWHPMPYLDRGEYYSELGSFDVRITLPENYWVAATGELQTEAEKQRLLAHAQACQRRLAEADNLATTYVEEEFPASAAAMKSLHYQAENVHDFAWFADKRFQVLHDTLVLPDRSGAVAVWSFFTATEAALWKESLHYLKSATRFFSQKIATYPYPQVTAVQAALSAGGGMEYPMITVIAQSGSAQALDEVIAHEVGHNWFYGILASNERDHAWMDEGFNSYYERRYMQARYPNRRPRYRLLGQPVDLDRLGYRYLARLGQHQSPDTPGDELDAANYWMTAYSLPAMALEQLEQLYSQDSIDRAMQAYYQQWAFRHPRPEDLQTVMETSLGSSLDWFFQGFMQSAATFQPKLRKQGNKQLLLQNRGAIAAPSLLYTPTDTLRVFTYPTQLPSAAAEWQPNPLALYDQPQGLPRLRWITGDEEAQQPSLFLAPLAGWNEQDGQQMGLFIHNRTLAPQRLEFFLAPLFGLGSGQINGAIGGRWRLPDGASQTTQRAWYSPLLFAGLARFSHRSFQTQTYSYRRLGLGLRLQKRHAATTGRRSEIQARFVALAQDRPSFSTVGELEGSATNTNYFGLLSYERSRQQAIQPSRTFLQVEYGLPSGTFEENFLKLSLRLQGGYQYEKKQWIRWELFGGYFLANPLRDRNFAPAYAWSLVDHATADYRYEGLFAGRNTNKSGYDQQLGGEQGGFRAPIGAAFGFGRSNDYMATLNLTAHLPFVPSGWPLVAYLDAGSYGRSPIRVASESGFQWVGGFGLSFLQGQLGIYAPLVGSPELKNLLDQRENFFNRLLLQANFRILSPWQSIDRVKI